MTKTPKAEPAETLSPEETTGSLIPLEAVNLPQMFTTGSGLDEFLAEMRRRTADIIPDTSTETGRKEIRSLAYRVSRTKTTVDEAGKAFTEELRANLKSIDANRSKIRTALDALRDEVRAPVEEWEAAEELRQQAELAKARAEAEEHERAAERGREIQSRIDALAASPAGYVGLPLAAAESHYAALRARRLSADDYGDRLDEAEAVRAEALTKIDGLLQMQRRMAQLEAEAEAVRKAEAERRAKEEERIAQERRAEEQRLRAEREAEEQRQRAEREAAKVSHRRRIRGEASSVIVEQTTITNAQAKALVGMSEAGVIPHVSIEF